MKATWCFAVLISSLTQTQVLAQASDYDLSSLSKAVQPIVSYPIFQPRSQPIQTRASRYAQLPQVSTASVEFNICDMPFTRDRGSSGIPIPDYNPDARVTPPSDGGGGGPTGGGDTGGGDTGGGDSGGAGPAGYVKGAPSYRYTRDGAYMTGSGIIVYPNGRKERGGPMFRYRSGYGFTDMNRPGMGYTWDRSEVYSYYQ